MDPFKPYEPRSRLTVPKLTASDAEAIALKAVAWIVADDVMLSRFVALTGCGEEEMRARIGVRSFMGSVLDFLLGDEQSVIDFATHEGFSPEVPMLARSKLP